MSTTTLHKTLDENSALRARNLQLKQAIERLIADNNKLDARVRELTKTIETLKKGGEA